MKNTNTISGKRFQIYESGNKVHVHDDNAGIKFESIKNDFKKDTEDALKRLDKKDGIIKINGKKKINLYLCREGKNFNAFVIKEGKSDKKEIEKFLRSL